jgi:hypothetical protein
LTCHRSPSRPVTDSQEDRDRPRSSCPVVGINLTLKSILSIPSAGESLVIIEPLEYARFLPPSPPCHATPHAALPPLLPTMHALCERAWCRGALPARPPARPPASRSAGPPACLPVCLHSRVGFVEGQPRGGWCCVLQKPHRRLGTEGSMVRAKGFRQRHLTLRACLCVWGDRDS